MSAGGRRVIDVPVTEVTLLEDRAHVTRKVKQHLPAGPARFRIDCVAPVVVDKTLVARFTGGAEARVHDVRVVRERRVLREDRPEAIRELDAQIETAMEAEQELTARRSTTAQLLAALGQVVEYTVAEVSVDASWGKLDAAAARARLRETGEREQALRVKLVDLDQEIRRAQEGIARMKVRRGQMEQAGTQAQAWLEIDATVDAAGDHELVVSYLVAGACWRPQHTARLVGTGKEARVKWECLASIWQATGEHWKDVRVVLSTERASLGLEPPVLTSDVLSVQKKAKAVVVEARDQTIETAGLGAGEGAAVVRAATVPGIDDGGETRRLAAPRPATVPSDGRPHRVPLFAFEGPAETELVLMAELARSVILRSVSVNAAEHPILAGPVDLVRDAGFVGRTSVLFVAPGEKLELGWGPEGALRVQREVEQLKQESSLLGNWVTAAHDVNVRISNLGAAPRRVRVVERVPVSEVEKVQVAVERESTTGGRQPDADGIVTWDLAVPGDGHETVQLRVVMKKHTDVQGV